MELAATSDPIRDAPAIISREDDLETLLRSLPSCHRCRGLKKRCDTQLPACANCTRFGAECTFFDHVLNEKISRGHIDSLVRRLKHADARPPALPNTRSPEYHFVDVRGAFRLAGLRSHLAGRHSQAVERETARPSQDYPHCPPFDMPSGLDINAQMHAFLMDKYLNICHTVYPILEDDLPLLHDPSFVGTEIDPWQHFVLNMVYAIGCHCLAKNDPRLVMLSESCYRAAQMHFEGIMSELNTEALQAVLLLALYSLFDPQKGNIGQQIAFAHRLEVELTEREGENLGPTLSRLRKVTFCLGTQVSSVLDRSVGFHATELDREFTLDASDEAHFVYSLYFAQAAARHQNKHAVPTEAELDDLSFSPMARTIACETAFLLKSDVKSASRLLDIYSDGQAVFNVLTPQWAFKACTHLLSSCSQLERKRPCVQGLGILDRCTLKWPHSEALRTAVLEQSINGV